MGYIEDLFNQGTEGETIPIKKDIDENLNKIKEILKNNDDVIYREFKVGDKDSLRFATIYIEGLADRDLINENVINTLMMQSRIVEPNVKSMNEKVYTLIRDGAITVSDIKELDDINLAVDNILSGETVLLIDNWDKALVISSKGWPSRGVSEPDTDTVIRGSREGLLETMRFNTALIRRRIRDPKLKVKQLKIGKRSKTDVTVMFIEDIVDKQLLETVVERLKNIDTDRVFESGIIEQHIQDNWRSPFPQVQITERPDRVAAALYEGRIGIITDNTPFVILVPTTFNILLHASEDYHERFLVSNFVRILRYGAVFLSLLLPALYIGVTSYHPEMIPTELAIYISGSRDGVPFPAFIEALLMEGSLELLREAGIRLPGPIGATIGIVGGLVLGQAAVDAGIVSNLMVIVVAITAIASYTTPNYSFSLSFRLLRFAFMASAAFLGLFGVMMSFVIMLTHLCNLKSFGVPYLSPFSVYNVSLKDFKDSFVVAPSHLMKKRPSFVKGRDRVRVQDKNKRRNYLEKDEDQDGQE